MRKLLFSFLIGMLGASVLASTALAQGGRLSGTVVDDLGEPIAGASVLLENPAVNNQPLIEQTTDNSGRFSIIGLRSGQWNLTVSAEGFLPNPGFVRIRRGENPPVNMTMARIKHPLVIALGEEAFVGLDPDAIEQELAAADAAFNTEQWQVALDAYSAILVKLPIMHDLNMQIGNCHRSLENYEAAIAAYEAGLAGDSELKRRVDTEIGRTRMAMGDFSGATAALINAAEGAGAAREDLYNLGEIEFAKGEIDAAAEWYEKAVSLDPNWAKPLFKLALVALNKGDMDTAKTLFAQVVEKEPNSEEAAQAQATLAALP